MDLTNPLSDAHPPRYAYESDDEDEFDAPSEDVPNPTSTPEPLDFKLRSMGTLTPHESLIIASGDAGKAWVEGAELGEQQGGIYVNDIQVRAVQIPPCSDNLTCESCSTGWTAVLAICSREDSYRCDFGSDHYASCTCDAPVCRVCTGSDSAIQVSKAH